MGCGRQRGKKATLVDGVDEIDETKNHGLIEQAQ